jgi:hypothetical protein
MSCSIVTPADRQHELAKVGWPAVRVAMCRLLMATHLDEERSTFGLGSGNSGCFVSFKDTSRKLISSLDTQV